MEEEIDLEIVKRRMWNAYPPVSELEPLKHPVKFVFCLNTHSDPCQTDTECEDRMRRLQVVHTKDGKTPDLRSNFVIGEDGRVYEGRGWHYQPTLPVRYSKYNNQSLLIAFVGRYEADKLPKSMEIYRETLVNFGIEEKYIHCHFIPRDIFDEATLPKLMDKLREDLVEVGIKNNYIDKDFEPVELFEQLNMFPDLLRND